MSVETRGSALRLWRFLKKPLHEKSRSLFVWWTARFPNRPAPLLLPSGLLWVVRKDNASEPISEGRFEIPETRFVERFLRPGMVVLDIGAHHGYYTLLASKRVGFRGKVIAFEPSPREQKALRLHARLNQCWNVTVEQSAVGGENTTGTLHVVEGFPTGCNSLRQPIVSGRTSEAPVRIVRLDSWMLRHGFERVDFIKLDVEGGELAALEGAEQMLRRQPRPVILAEVQDIRTRPWGYAAKRILAHLKDRNFTWFSIGQDGSVDELDLSPNEFEGNFVACPRESIHSLGVLRSRETVDVSNS